MQKAGTIDSHPQHICPAAEHDPSDHVNRGSGMRERLTDHPMPKARLCKQQGRKHSEGGVMDDQSSGGTHTLRTRDPLRG